MYYAETKGATSALIVAPGTIGESDKQQTESPKGVVVALLCNIEGVKLGKLAIDVARCYQDLEEEKPDSVHQVYQC